MFAQRAQREHREKMPGLKTKDMARTENTEGAERTQRIMPGLKNIRASSHGDTKVQRKIA